MPENSKSKLILASASQRRLDLLNNMGFSPEKVIAAEIDETPLKAEKPLDYVKRVAKEKAIYVNQLIDNKQYFILAADTIASVGTRILGKPKDAEDAKRILQLMSGRRHRVYTAICLITPDEEINVKTTMTYVKFKNINPKEMEEYISSEAWKGKAGAYGLQEDPGGFVISINGSYSGVIGLPQYETKNLLSGMGFRQN